MHHTQICMPVKQWLFLWVKSLNISQTHKLLDAVQNSQEVMLSQGFQEVQSLHHQEASDPANLVLG